MTRHLRYFLEFSTNRRPPRSRGGYFGCLELADALDDAADDADRELLDFLAAIEMRGVDGDVVADERQAFFTLLDFLDSGVFAIDEYDGNLAILDGLLDTHDDGVAVVYGRLHR